MKSKSKQNIILEPEIEENSPQVGRNTMTNLPNKINEDNLNLNQNNSADIRKETSQKDIDELKVQIEEKRKQIQEYEQDISKYNSQLNNIRTNSNLNVQKSKGKIFKYNIL